MDARIPLQQPKRLPCSFDNVYYGRANALTDQTWDTIFDNLSKYPGFDLGTRDAGGDDMKTYIRRRLACLLPDGNCYYGLDQIIAWISLVKTPLIVSNDDLQKVIAMDDIRYPCSSTHTATPGARGFFVCSWTISVSEFDILYNQMRREERTFHELVAWDTFIAENELGLDDRITIRYIGSCALSEWPIKLVQDICKYMEDDRSGILAEFIPALASELQTVAKACHCHLIRHITTSADDKEGFHELVHSILIEFFGAPYVLNRHPDSKSLKWCPKRADILSSIDLQLDYGSVDWRFLECPLTMLSKLRIHFDKMMRFVARNRNWTGTESDILRLDQAKLMPLLWQSLPQYYRRNKAIMVIAARAMRINDYIRGRHFALCQDPGNQLISQILSRVKDIDLRLMCVAPFAYYCIAPWPRPNCLAHAIVTFGKSMATSVARKCGYRGLFTTDAYLGNIGLPAVRRTGTHYFIHVPLLDPNRCRYGVDYVDEAAFKFMQTSFWNTMVIADMVMRVLEDKEAIELEMAAQTDSEGSYNDTSSAPSEDDTSDSAVPPVREPTEANESGAICRLALRSYLAFSATDVGKAFFAQLDDDYQGLDQAVEKEFLFIP
ncbi:hypothetical protein F4859DRAFT_509827 [Xylaria cf. heliscus]|nr:hypothetical protein F4859DRAFT_509827 [Xylaria cf. heliscus]